jgi:hypothetical protein
MPLSRIAILLLALAPAAAWASPAALCRQAILRNERAFGIPDQFLNAIGRVETGRPDPETGSRAPWPWSVNAEGEGHYYPTRQAAIDAVRAFQARGVRSIDVGCLQVNLLYHPDAFASLDQAFDPEANARYAATLLRSLFQETGSWPHAAAAYHSHTPALGADYQRQVLQAWAEPLDGPGEASQDPASSPGPRPLPALPLPEARPLLAPAPLFARPGAARGAGSLYGRPAGAPLPGGAGPSLAGLGGVPGPVATPSVPGLVPALGRDLAAYRRMPVRLAINPPPPPPPVRLASGAPRA